MPATERLPGALGPYRLQDRLGEGGMGVVHLARDPQGRPVAIKVLHAAATEGDNARLRLAREVETMRRVRSPFVAEVLDADVTGEFPYIVTRYVPGTTLDEMVHIRGPLSGSGLRRLAYGTAEALAAIHAAGVVHRDLKPGNVMLSDDRPVVIDFGIAQLGDATRLTETGLVMGTPGYLAPEVIEGQPSSPASDVHSWGATMAFAATGRPPYGSGSYESIFFRIISGQADLAGAPAALVPLITAALARDPAQRPPARWLGTYASALDPSAMSRAPAAPGAGPSPAAGLNGASAANGRKARKRGNNGLPRDRKDPYQPPGQAYPAPGQAYPAPGQAYPAPKQAAKDVADLLPPVAHAPFPPPAPSAPGSLAPAPGSRDQAPLNGRDSRAPQGSRAPQAPQGPGAPQAPQGRGAPQAPAALQAQRGRTTMAGLAVMITAVALTVMLPVAGLLVSLGVITLLRAADLAQSTLAVRRSMRGPRPSDLLVVVVTAPLAVARALFTEVLMAPLAFLAAAATYVAAVAVTPSLALSRAGAYASAVIVAWYGIGPGSRRPRRQLNRMAGAVARTPLSAAATALAVWALAIGVAILAVSQTPYYWPVMNPHLPTLHGWPSITSLLPTLHGWPFITSHLPRLHRFGAHRLPGLPRLVPPATNWLCRYS
jgi:predicted Ser/Thr protein kinase